MVHNVLFGISYQEASPFKVVLSMVECGVCMDWKHILKDKSLLDNFPKYKYPNNSNFWFFSVVSWTKYLYKKYESGSSLNENSSTCVNLKKRMAVKNLKIFWKLYLIFRTDALPSLDVLMSMEPFTLKSISL